MRGRVDHIHQVQEFSSALLLEEVEGTFLIGSIFSNQKLHMYLQPEEKAILFTDREHFHRMGMGIFGRDPQLLQLYCRLKFSK